MKSIIIVTNCYHNTTGDCHLPLRSVILDTGFYEKV